MSRYYIKSKDKKYAYGFDRVLSEYFIQEIGRNKINSEASGPASRVLEYMFNKEIEIPQAHTDAMVLDLPF